MGNSAIPTQSTNICPVPAPPPPTNSRRRGGRRVVRTSTPPPPPKITAKDKRSAKRPFPSRFTKRQHREFIQERQLQDKQWQEQRDNRSTHFPPCPQPSDHIRFLHGTTFRDKSHVRYAGLRQLGRQQSELWQYKALKLDTTSLLKGSHTLLGQEQTYITQADFKRSDDKLTRNKCTRDQLRSIGTIFVDVDIYQSGLSTAIQGLSPDEVADKICAHLAEFGIPNPVVIFSGRGLYLYWALEKRFLLQHESQRQRWERVQGRIVSLLTQYGADPAVRDLTRVLRLVGTVNPKSGERVRVLRDDGKYHSFESLEKLIEHLPNQLPPLKITQSRLYGDPRKALQSSSWTASQEKVNSFRIIISKLRERFGINAKTPPSKHSIAHRYYRIFLDLCTLAVLRKGVADGWRNNFVFWGINCLFLARMIEVKDIPWASNLLASICEDNYNTYNNSCLNTLIARASYDEAVRKIKEEQAKKYKKIFKGKKTKEGIKFVRRSLGGFQQGFSGKNNPIPKELRFQGWGRNIYTPSVQHLINVFNISIEEQRAMRTLVGEQVHKERRAAKNKSFERAQRNHLIATSSAPVHELQKQWGLSRASIYRIQAQRERWLKAPIQPSSEPIDLFDIKTTEQQITSKALVYQGPALPFVDEGKLLSYFSLLSIGKVNMLLGGVQEKIKVGYKNTTSSDYHSQLRGRVENACLFFEVKQKPILSRFTCDVSFKPPSYSVSFSSKPLVALVKKTNLTLNFPAPLQPLMCMDDLLPSFKFHPYSNSNVLSGAMQLYGRR